VVRDKMMHHLVGNGLIKDSQHGFLEGKNCSTNLLEFLESVTSSLDRGVPVDIVYLDFAKAFDKVPRKRLIQKVIAHGLHPELVKWIDAWLTGRKQRVVVNGKKSTWQEVLSGVPQGSVLGPILFLIYINDLDGAARLANIVKKFADDTKLGKEVRAEKDREELQQALDELCEWANTWGMSFNVSKCRVMHTGHNNPRYQYTMNGEVLKETEEETDIGVTVTANMKYSAQCRKAARTAQTVLAQVSRAFHFRDRNVFIRLYTTYVRPHLEFSVPAWSPGTQADIECLERVQQRAVGMVSGLKGRTYEEKLLELNMVSLQERRHQLDMVQVYKIVTGKDMVKKDTWFKGLGEGGRDTRASADPLNLRIPAPRLEIRRSFFSQRVPAQWNRIPAEIKAARTATAFKSAYRAFRRDQMAAARVEQR
jgi:ribonucleases P/MRP protein subunit RPP40